MLILITDQFRRTLDIRPPWAMALRLAWVLALFIPLGPFGAGSAAQAQGPTTLRCRIDQDELNVGAETDLFIDILEVEGLYGYQLELTYPTDQIQFQDRDPVRDGVNLETDSFLNSDQVLFNTADNTTGRVQMAVFQLSPSTPKSGSGILAVATILGNNPGPASFAFENVVLSDQDGNALPHELQGCSIDVIVPAPAPATCYDFDAGQVPGIDDVQTLAELWRSPGQYDITYDVAPAGSPDGVVDIRDIMEVVVELGNPCES